MFFIPRFFFSSFSGLSRESPAKQSIAFLRAARFLAPENQAAVEALINDLDLEFMGAEKVEPHPEDTKDDDVP